MRTPAAILAIAPALAGCPAPVTLDMDRLGESYLADTADPASLLVAEAGPALRDCGVGAGISDGRPEIGVVDGGRFWRAAFPEPVPWATVQTVLADPAVAERVAPLDVDYLVAIGGDTTRTPTNGSMSCSLQGCGGVLWHQEWTDLEATIWDLEDDAAVEALTANGSAKSIMAAVILPVVWLEPYTRATTCRTLGREIGAVVAERHDGDAAQVALVGLLGSAMRAVDAGRIEDLAERAAEGDEAALYELAAHFQRLGDWDTAPRWQAETQYRLALNADGAERRQWLCRAANAGHAAAQARAGWAVEADVHTEGAVEADLAEAYKWYRLALLNGEIAAAEDMQRLRARMTEAEVAEAERRASEWRPGGCDAAGSAVAG